MPHMTDVKCRTCGKVFQARTADVNRGWGRFCSKSCKAKKQGRLPASKETRAAWREGSRQLPGYITHDEYGDPKLCACGDVATRFVRNGFGHNGFEGQCDRCADDTHPFDSGNFNNV